MSSPIAAELSDHPILRRSGPAAELIVDGRPFVMLAGEVHNSSASSLAYMQTAWERLKDLHCNTALVPVSWELIEPREGGFDFALVDGLIDGARQHGLKLVFLWFGTWKNAMATYAPEWVKTDLQRFPRAQLRPGENSGALSAFSEAGCQADAAAFAALMRHIRAVDGREHTVVMMQVENEAGLLGAPRDRSAAAEQRFAENAPWELLEHLQIHRETLAPELRAVWENPDRPEAGSWASAFGAAADEVFMAWHIGRYIDRVAQAGRAEYPLPMFVNAWLVQYDEQPPGEYPSGGPVSRMADVWRCAAPNIDLLAPDIYLLDFARVCEQYARDGNPLLIPEARSDAPAAANVFYALAQHDALCFAPFGVDSMPAGHPLAASYRLLGDLWPAIAPFRGTGRMAGVLQRGEQAHMIDLGGYRLRVRFTRPLQEGRAPGAGLIVAESDDTFLVAGLGFAVDFLPRPGGLPRVDFLSLNEGDYQDGAWMPGRRLNGDEYALVLGEAPGVRRARLYSYA
jgi:hypothetical protein